MSDQINYHFVLSGGGLRGLAHLGVIKAFEEAAIRPDKISGTSAGAMAGAFLADGLTPDEILDIFKKHIGVKLVAWNSFKMGLVSMVKIKKFLEQYLSARTFEELNYPLFITATDFLNGKQKIFEKGLLADALLASCAIPALFPPVFIDGIPYVDGGLSNNLPVEPFMDGLAETIAVHVNPLKPFKMVEGVFEVLDRALHLSFRSLVHQSAAGCRLFIEPPGLQSFGMFETDKLEDIFNCGYLYTRELLIKDVPLK